MPIHNGEISRILNEMADLLEIKGENQFRVRAYRNGARSVENLPKPASQLLEEETDLSSFPGIGDAIAEKIRQLLETGAIRQHEQLKKELPPGLLDILKIPEVGPRRVGDLYRHLGVKDLDDLAQAARDDRIDDVPGFGRKLSESIRRNVASLRTTSKERRILLSEAEEIATGLMDHLTEESGRGGKNGAVERIEVAGSYRRRKETVGDLDILVIAEPESGIMDRFVGYDGVERVVSHGETRSSVILQGGTQVDLRLLDSESYGAALMYFTGSKEHNVAIRRIAQDNGFKVSEYGIFRSGGENDTSEADDRTGAGAGERVAGATEEEVFGILGMDWIPPELRENLGEIEAAQEGRLPVLIDLKDIRGDLHAHTNWSDGMFSLEEMAQAAMQRGYEYLAVTDHSRGLTVANGLDEERLAEQIDEIARLNEGFQNFRLLASTEVNINRDGSLDLSDEVLRRLDMTVCSIHSALDLDRDKQTERILRAMDNPCCSIIGHPTGRRLGKRQGYDLDFERIYRAAAEKGVALEINAQPERLDLPDADARRAAEAGVMIAVSTDAHSTRNLDYMRFGVGQARRAWLTAKDVLNTRSLKELQQVLRR
ncbi:MAG: DNA polymerase/3'-5' exonuclease PolX [Spirochaetaceae bacterium]